VPTAYPKVIEIFDRMLVRRNRNRAAAEFSKHDFLFKWTADNLADRLKDIKREFPRVLQVGGRAQLHDLPGAKDLIVMDMAEKFVARGGVQADDEFMPFAPGSFDLVISPLSLHMVNDLPGTLIQMNRTLKPDGLCLAALFGGKTLWELRKVLMQTDIKLKGGASPHIAPFADKKQVGALMQRARFALPVVDSDMVTVTYENMAALLHDLRGMGEANSLKDRGRKSSFSRAFLADAEQLYKESFAEPDGRLRATFEVIFLIGWGPHESQPKPLKPGSATGRLSDALGTKEVGSGVKPSDGH